MIRNAMLLFTPCVIAIAAGCSKPRGEVEGTVTLDGAPAANTIVTFIPDYDAGAKDGLPATGVTDENGHYKLRSSSEAQKGVFVGKHVVVCETPKFAPPADANLKLPKVTSTTIPAAYGNPEKSPLRFEVKEGPQTIDVPLTSKPKVP